MTRCNQSGLGIEALLALPIVRAEEYSSWSLEGDSAPSASRSAPRPGCAFVDDREYRFCKAVVEHPLRPSSAYPRIVGMSPKTAQAIRGRLIDKNLIREHQKDTGQRGGRTLLLEATPAGVEAVAKHAAGAADQTQGGGSLT